jgi:8-oxo-dGTP diphosphatase
MTDELLTTREAAQMLRVGQSTLTRWIRLGQLRAVRLPSGKLRVRRSDVERVFEQEASEYVPAQPPKRQTRQRSQPAKAATAPATVSAPAKKRDRKDRPVAMAIVVQDGKALMTHRRYKEPAFQWNFVSGEVELGEKPEQAALREVREEVGLEVAIEHRLGDRIQPVSKRHMHYFICRVVGGDVQLVDHEENTEVAWCTRREVYEHFEELAQIPGGMYPPLFEYLDRVLTTAPV